MLPPSNTEAFQAQGTLTEVAKRVEGLTESLLTTFNTAYLGADRTAAAGFQPSSADLNGNNPAVFGLFDFNYSGAKDTTGTIGLPDTADLNALVASGAVKNFSSILTLATTDPRHIAAALDASGGAATAIYSPGDNRNAVNMAAFQNTAVASISYGTSTIATNVSFGDFYNQMVGYVGNLKALIRIGQKC